MKVQLHFLLIAFHCWSSTGCRGQSPTWMARYHADILTSMKIDYKKPAGFEEVRGRECFKSIPKLELIIGCAGNQLHSMDGEFIAFIPIYRLMTSGDSIFFKKIASNGAFHGVDRVHEGNIRSDIEYGLGKDAAKDWKKYVHYYPPEEARHKFNADTAVSFSIKLTGNEYYQGKYHYLSALYLQRKGRGFINFYCLYTEEAKRNYSTYWEAIQGALRYRD